MPSVNKERSHCQCIQIGGKAAERIMKELYGETAVEMCAAC